MNDTDPESEVGWRRSSRTRKPVRRLDISPSPVRKKTRTEKTSSNAPKKPKPKAPNKKKRTKRTSSGGIVPLFCLIFSHCCLLLCREFVKADKASRHCSRAPRRRGGRSTPTTHCYVSSRHPYDSIRNPNAAHAEVAGKPSSEA